jgi:hypothetical protein
MVCAETCLAGSIACLAVPAINRWDLCDSLRVVLLVYQLTKQGQAFSARQLIVLVLIVVLILDLLGFCAEKRADLLGNYFVPLPPRTVSGPHKPEHEDDDERERSRGPQEHRQLFLKI